MGFHEKWIALVMMCVSTVAYSVLINGMPKGSITPTRGLRQGDPISPYLFLLCEMGLSTLLRKREMEGLLHGVAVKRGAPTITHLFFANDSIIFSRVTREECDQVADVLSVYEMEWGQKLNEEKTTLFFSKTTPRKVQEAIKEVFGGINNSAT